MSLFCGPYNTPALATTVSFEKLAEALTSELESKRVPIEKLCFDKNSSGKLAHEIQFKMKIPTGIFCYTVNPNN